MISLQHLQGKGVKIISELNWQLWLHLKHSYKLNFKYFIIITTTITTTIIIITTTTTAAAEGVVLQGYK